MSILTNLPITATCGTPTIVTIDKAQFVTDFGIVDPYWGDSANWQEIEFYYVNNAYSLQVKKMSFAGNTYSLNMKTNIWDGIQECKKVTIMDGNGATLAFARASFPVAGEFDFSTTGGYSTVPVYLKPAIGMVSPYIQDIYRDASDANLLYLTSDGSNSSIGTSLLFSNNMVLNDLINDSDAQFTNLLSDPIITCFHITDDFSKIYVAGSFGLTFDGAPLPPLSGGPNFTIGQSRIIEIDVATQIATWKMDIADVGVDAFGINVFSMTSDATNLYIHSTAKIAAQDLATGARVWIRDAYCYQSGYFDVKKGSKMLLTATDLYTNAFLCDGISRPSGAIFKMSLIDGAVDTAFNTAFPISPAETGNWDMSPDRTKIVFSELNYGVQVLSSGVWTNYSLDISAFDVVCKNDSFYVLGSIVNTPPYAQGGKPVIKFDYSGTFIATVVNGPANANAYPYSYNRLAISATKAYCWTGGVEVKLQRFTLSTGAIDATYKGMAGMTGNIYLASDYVFCENQSITAATFYDNRSIQFVAPTITKYDLTTKQIVHAQNIGPAYQVDQFISSTLLPDTLIGISQQIRGFDLSVIPFTMNILWPYLNNAAPEASHIDGQYIYMLAQNIGGSYYWIDGLGNYNGQYLTRMDINTKLLDRTFNPVFPTLGVVYPWKFKISSTTDYIYVCDSEQVYRVKKSDNSVDLLTNTAMGISEVLLNFQYNFVEQAGGKVLMYSQDSFSGDSRINGKSYAILNETTMVIDSQPASTDILYKPVYNSFDNCIYSVSINTGIKYYVKYDITDDARTLYSTNLEAGDNALGIFSAPLPYDSTFFTLMFGMYTRKLMRGVVKLEPFADLV